MLPPALPPLALLELLKGQVFALSSSLPTLKARTEMTQRITGLEGRCASLKAGPVSIHDREDCYI